MVANNSLALSEQLKMLGLDPKQTLDILDLFGINLFATDLEGRYTLANKTFLETVQLDSYADLLGKTVFDLYDESVAAQIHADDQIVLRDGTPFTGTDELISEITGENQASLKGKTQLLDEQGNVIGLIGFFRDISDRVEQAKALKHSEERNRAIIEAMPDALILMDADGFYLDAIYPPNFINVLRRNPIGQNRSDIHPANLSNKFAQLAQKALKTGTAQIGDYTIEHKGKIIRRELRYVAVNETEVLAIVRDITEQRKNEEAWQKSVERDRALLEAIPDIILIIAKDGTIEELKAPRDIETKNTIGKLAGGNLLDIVPSTARASVKSYLDQDPQTKVMLIREVVLVTSDGIKEHEIHLAHINEHELLAVVHNINDWKEAEKENSLLVSTARNHNEQLRSMNQQLAEAQENERRKISQELHDRTAQDLAALNVNLTIIQSQLSLDTPATQSVLSRINDSCGLIEQSIKQVRNLMSELRPRELDDFGLLAGLQRFAFMYPESAGLSVKVSGKHIVPRLQTKVETDLFRIAQEAVKNAEKHAKATEVNITILQTTNTISLTITDNGDGFDIDAYFSNPNKQSWGLLLMQERAVAAGGSFEIESTLGNGTTVTVEVSV